jgi:Holliday junction resolvase RusA-like endonuclease
METRFTIEAEPVPASRPRVTTRGVPYYPKKHTAYSEYLKQSLKEVGVNHDPGPVEVRLLFVMPPYKTSDHPVHRADVDNLAKLPLDSMTKIMGDDEHPVFWPDDCFVSSLMTFKRFAREGEQPHTKVRIKSIKGSIEDHVDEAFENG